MRSDDDPNKIKGIKISQKYYDDSVFQFKISIVFQKDDVKKKIDLVINEAETVVDVDFDWIIVNDHVQSLCCVIYSKFLLEKLIPIKYEIGEFNNELIYSSPRLSKRKMNVDKEICELCSEFKDY